MTHLAPVPTRTRLTAVALALLSMCIAACITTGTAVGELKGPANQSGPVTLTWKSEAGTPDRGTLEGTLPDGTHYAGRYFQVIQTAAADFYSPAWVGWQPFWPGWRARWYPGPMYPSDIRGFVTIYTGKVIANLASDDEKVRLRCRFDLHDPRAGLVRGASGDCELSNGTRIEQVIVGPD
jgi:hypothetical protein